MNRPWRLNVISQARMLLHYLVKCQMMHSSWRRHWPVAWSTLIEPGMWFPNNPKLNPVDYAVRDALQQMAYQCWRFTIVNQLKKAVVAKCGKVPQRFGWTRHWSVASQASMHRLAARQTHWKFDVKTVRCNFFKNNCDNKHVVSVVNFLKCVVTNI